MNKSQHIAVILSKINPIKYKNIIERSIRNGYHEFKFDNIPGFPEYGECTGPKTQLINDLEQYPELSELKQRVYEGEFDDSCDDEDNLKLYKYLIENEEMSEEIMGIMGIKKPTDILIEKDSVINFN